jgi:DNA repair exonuclease SbcCD ATPase subunit
MRRNSGKQDTKEDRNVTETKGKLEDDVDALYRLPLAEFTAARNTLAGRLKQGGRGNEADFVKALVKPSISAWAVNQLYWKHREAFDRLIATGERFRKAQTSRLARKVADIRGALDARREALSHVSDLATALLRDAGHNPTPDTMRRVVATLEAMSVYASIPDAPRPGRLTHDVDPPGFESLASLISGASMTERTKEPARVTQSQESGRAATSTRRKAESAADVRQLEETRQAKIAAAKVSLQEAKGLLIEARARAQSLEAAQKKTYAEAKDAEKHRHEAEEHFEKARAASEEAARHAQSIAAEVRQSAKAVEDAKRTVEKASKELEKMFRESPAR